MSDSALRGILVQSCALLYLAPLDVLHSKSVSSLQHGLEFALSAWFFWTVTGGGHIDSQFALRLEVRYFQNTHHHVIDGTLRNLKGQRDDNSKVKDSYLYPEDHETGPFSDGVLRNISHVEQVLKPVVAPTAHALPHKYDKKYLLVTAIAA
ncbi:hypothetical protein FIBSPDRAFT_941116 [Athelia psychrophila]|uniref:Uncharacterized protein n=1 Tax=Athelia psychrophila TaxID=1759441 RepID=A0A167URU4_9AGAM|nr:hypothetical protein FIBSPDRAFT_941116 [Fibularhizoctonia sp. CBS 109695]